MARWDGQSQCVGRTGAKDEVRTHVDEAEQLNKSREKGCRLSETERRQLPSFSPNTPGLHSSRIHIQGVPSAPV